MIKRQNIHLLLLLIPINKTTAMPDSIKQTLREEYKRLKKAFEKVLKPNKKERVPQLVLQPVRNKKLY